MNIDHDRLFKELLISFFVEFVELFLPDVADYLDPNSLEFLDKEVFTDVTEGERREVDLIVKARFKGEEAFFLVHIENQAHPQSNFAQRMFKYFARLHEKYQLPVYPVAVFSYTESMRQEPTEYRVAFPGKTVLQFEYTSIQLNLIPWQQYINQPNPVASALMARMQMAVSDRPRVKLECLRLLATLKLDPAKSQLIGGFIDTYLKLNAEEYTRYYRELEQLADPEKEETMKLMTSWHLEGIEEGRLKGREEGVREGIERGLARGKEDVLVRQLTHRLGELSGQALDRIDQLSGAQLDQLSIELLDFTSASDLDNWLARASRSVRDTAN
jgi:Domain of unknown function (DUF4351)/Putative transposase, YhgA-like